MATTLTWDPAVPNNEFTVGTRFYSSHANQIQVAINEHVTELNTLAGLVGQSLNTDDDVTFNTVTSTGTLTAANLDTGQGANILYPMNQAVRTTDGVTFASAEITGALTGISATFSGLLTADGDLRLRNNPDVYLDVDNQRLLLNGGSGAETGANLQLYGPTHPTLPSVARLKINNITSQIWNADGSTTFGGDVSVGGSAFWNLPKLTIETDGSYISSFYRNNGLSNSRKFYTAMSDSGRLAFVAATDANNYKHSIMDLGLSSNYVNVRGELRVGKTTQDYSQSLEVQDGLSVVGYNAGSGADDGWVMGGSGGISYLRPIIAGAIFSSNDIRWDGSFYDIKAPLRVASTTAMGSEDFRVGTGGIYSEGTSDTNQTGVWATASDEAVKQNIREVSDPLDKVIALSKAIMHFEYKEGLGKPEGTRTQYIAQLLEENGFGGHVKEVNPSQAEGELLGWEYDEEGNVITEGRKLKQVEQNFTPYLFGAVAELAGKFEALEKRLEEAGI